MIGAVILAAGESSRLDRPKQLLNHNGGTLIGHVIQTALASKCCSVVVVVGAYETQVRAEAERFKVQIVENDYWREGKASSIRAAVDTILRHTEPVSGILILTCDQPHVTTELLNELIDRFQKSDGMPVVSTYADTIGVPAIIPRRLFSELLQLRGDQGAQTLLHGIPDEVVTVSFAGGLLDIDSEADIRKWRSGGMTTA